MLFCCFFRLFLVCCVIPLAAFVWESNESINQSPSPRLCMLEEEKKEQARSEGRKKIET